MIITRNPDALDLPLPLDLSQGTSVTVGNFDGVHLGHQALLAMTCERAAATGTLPVAMTFNPHPLEVLTPYAPPRLTTPQARLALLEASGMALVMLVVFTPEFAAMSPETFVRRILLGTLNMRELLLGYDFTLGKGRAGADAPRQRNGGHERVQQEADDERRGHHQAYGQGEHGLALAPERLLVGVLRLVVEQRRDEHDEEQLRVERHLHLAAGHNGNEEPDDDLDERKRDARDNLVDERGRQDGDEQEQTEGQRFHKCISFWVSAMGE